MAPGSIGILTGGRRKCDGWIQAIAELLKKLNVKSEHLGIWRESACIFMRGKERQLI